MSQGGLKSVSRIECRPYLKTLLSTGDAERTANVFKALANPHRVQLLHLLARIGVPVCVCDLTSALGLAQSTTSHHLKQLVSAGLLRREQRGLWAYYSVDPEATAALADIVSLDRPATEATPVNETGNDTEGEPANVDDVVARQPVVAP